MSPNFFLSIVALLSVVDGKILFGFEGIPSCSENMTCQGRCLKFSINAKCQCDVDCTKFNDCCYDSNLLCHNSGSPTTLPLPTTHSSNVAYSCISLHPQANVNIMAISTCPEDYFDEEVKNSCMISGGHQSPQYVIPVIENSPSHHTYKNIFCAICNGVRRDRLTEWRFGYQNCSVVFENQSIFEVQSKLVHCQMALIPPDGYTWRQCPNNNIISTCPSNDSALRTACSYYQYLHESVAADGTTLRHYKNHHCALCHSAAKLGCSYNSFQVPPYKFGEILDVEISVNENKFIEFILSATQRHLSSGLRCTSSTYFLPIEYRCVPLLCGAGKRRFHNVCIVKANNLNCKLPSLLYSPKSYSITNNKFHIQLKHSSAFTLSVFDPNVGLDINNNIVFCVNSSMSGVIKNQLEAGGSFLYVHDLIQYSCFATGIISIVCTCIGMFFLLLVRQTNIFILMSFQLLLSLLLSMVSMIPRLLLSEEPTICNLGAVLDHYVWLVLFAWLCSLTYEQLQYQKVNLNVLARTSANQLHAPQLCLYLVVCWTAPLAMIVINTAIHYLNVDWLREIYGGKYCSISNLTIYFFSSVLPTAVLLFFSVFFLVSALYKHQTRFYNKRVIDFQRTWLSKSLIVLFLLGITWCLHLLYNVIHLNWANYLCTVAIQATSAIFGILLFNYSRKEIKRFTHQKNESGLSTLMNPKMRGDRTFATHPYATMTLCSNKSNAQSYYGVRSQSLPLHSLRLNSSSSQKYSYPPLSNDLKTVDFLRSHSEPPTPSTNVEMRVKPLSKHSSDVGSSCGAALGSITEIASEHNHNGSDAEAQIGSNQNSDDEPECSTSPTTVKLETFGRLDKLI